MLTRTLCVVAVAAGLSGAAALETGSLPLSWVPPTANCNEQPEWRVHQYNPDFFILRESGCTNYEKPFIYLIFGSEKALLLDTGAGKDPGTGHAVARLLKKWETDRGRSVQELLVVHSHGHRDHTAGDADFAAMPRTRVIPPDPKALAEFFTIAPWPAAPGRIDLGARILDILAIPGHEPASIAIYDRRTGVLLTGDSVYPGRLYVSEWEQFRTSMHRLAEFASSHPIAHVLGTHIEQTRTPFRDYVVGSTWQPDEHALELGTANLLELDQALAKAGTTPARIELRDLTVVPRTPRTARGPHGRGYDAEEWNRLPDETSHGAASSR